MGMEYAPAETVFGTVVYRRYTRNWRKPIANVPAGSGNSNLMPGPLIRARAGDRLRVHFKNLDTAFNRSHSMHFHGVHYKPSSDGAFVPGVSGRDGDVKPGQTWTYKLTAGDDSVGAWPYHDHGPSMHESIEGGMWGMLSILGQRERAPGPRVRRGLLADGQLPGDRRPRVRRQHAGVPLARRRPRPVGRDGDGLRAPHLPRPRAPLEERDAASTSTRRRSARPSRSAIRWREDAPGTWLYHCHVETHMEAGMIGTYQVSPPAEAPLELVSASGSRLKREWGLPLRELARCRSSENVFSAVSAEGRASPTAHPCRLSAPEENRCLVSPTSCGIRAAPWPCSPP